ncbi:MAG: hypothetical protein IJ791_04965 [Lachnospiraceae bacterium]|nr:hypothetical protein [Lachnospiraceae bacterium]
MVQEFKRMLHLRSMSYLTYGIILVVSFLFGGIFTYFLADTEAGDVLHLLNLTGIIFAYGVVLTFMFFHAMFYALELGKGLQFGCSRKRLFIGYRMTDLPIFALCVLMGFLCGGKDLFLYIFEGILALYVFYHLAQGIVGNLILKYGKIVYWIYYIIVIFSIVLLPRVLLSNDDLMMAIGRFLLDMAMNSVALILGLLAANGVALFINWLFLRKTPYNGMV